MRVGIHMFAGEAEEILARCREVGVNEVFIPTAAVAKAGRLAPGELGHLRARLAKGGVVLAGMILPRPSEAALGGGDEEGVEALCDTIQVMGQAGIGTALFYPLNIAAHAQEHGLAEPIIRVGGEGWTELVGFFQKVVGAAEKAEVRLASHVWDMRLMKALMAAVPSPYNGITYCQGMYILGEDPYGAVAGWGRERIFLSHARNLTKHGERFEDFEEVPLDKGDIDIGRCIELLHRVGWEGLIIPEHLGAGDGPRAVAEAVEYLQGVLSRLGALKG